MPFATTSDVSTRLGRGLTTEETAAADALIAGATALIAEAAGQTDSWAAELDPVPAIIKTVTVEVVARVMTNPDGAASVSKQIGSFQTTRSWRDAVGLELTTAERRSVRRAAGVSLTSVTLESPYSGPDVSVNDAILLDLEP